MDADIDINVDNTTELIKCLSKIIASLYGDADSVDARGADFSEVDKDGNCYHIVVKVKKWGDE